MKTILLGAAGLAAAIGGYVAVQRQAAPAQAAPATGQAKVAPGALVQAQGKQIVVELFTSQGCSSCPPADAVLEALAKEPGVIAISRPVTYWDRLGWKDTLAREENTSLQRAYATHGGVGAGVYTPQAVVQGNGALVGSRGAQLRQMVAEARARPQPSLIAGRGAVAIDGKTSGTATVSLIALRGHVDVAIGNGENGGRSVRYTNVFRGERTLGQWTGGKASFAIPAAALKVEGADRFAVIVRQGAAGPILAGRYY